jgi:hypothetical protein
VTIDGRFAGAGLRNLRCQKVLPRRGLEIAFEGTHLWCKGVFRSQPFGDSSGVHFFLRLVLVRRGFGSLRSRADFPVRMETGTIVGTAQFSKIRLRFDLFRRIDLDR